MTERIFRMYGLVPYNISPIQQGIQYGHAVVEYSNEFSNDADYLKWSRHDKTFIILNGGTTNTQKIGTMNSFEMSLYSMDIKHACFYEPDLGDQLTAVVFLVDERVWDKEKWPDFAVPFEDLEFYKRRKREDVPIENILSEMKSWQNWKIQFSDDEKEASKIVFLREMLSKLRLA